MKRTKLKRYNQIRRRKSRRLPVVLSVIAGILIIAAGFTYFRLWNRPVAFEVKNTQASFPLTTPQKLEDFEYLWSMLDQAFPYFEVKERMLNYSWRDQKASFEAMIRETPDDLGYYNTLSTILTRLQNGHTGIIPPSSYFSSYKDLYEGLTPWGQVFGSEDVEKMYSYWNTVVKDEDTYYVPVSFKYVEGNYYADKKSVLSNKSLEDYGVKPGSKLITVNGAAVDEYVKTLMDSRILRYDDKRDKLKLDRLTIKSTGPLSFEMETPTGSKSTVMLYPEAYSTTGGSNQAKPEHLFTAEILEEGSSAYLSLPSLASSYVDKDSKALKTFLSSVSGYETLIIDIRGNGGGSTSYWMNNIVPLLTKEKLESKNYLLFRDSDYLEPFIRNKMLFGFYGLKPLSEFAPKEGMEGKYFGGQSGKYDDMTYTVKPKSPVGFNGKIYLLVDGYVYSSAEALAAFSKETGWATLVGTHTGGDGIGYDPAALVLPQSGLIVRFPLEMGLNPDGSVNEEFCTQPDVYVEQTYEDFINGVAAGAENLSAKERISYDTVLKTVLEMARGN